MRDKGGKKNGFVDSCQSCLAFASVICLSNHAILFSKAMSKVVINNCVMKGQHVYEHAVNMGDTYECLQETNNSNDAKVIAVQST